MPVILRTQEETETWLAAPWSEEKSLQRTAPDEATCKHDKQLPCFFVYHTPPLAISG